MNNRQLKTLESLFELPTRADIRWSEIVSLFRAIGAEVEQREGSRVAILLADRKAIVHQPHPNRVCGRGLARELRDFLDGAGIRP